MFTDALDSLAEQSRYDFLGAYIFAHIWAYKGTDGRNLSIVGNFKSSGLTTYYMVSLLCAV